MCEYVDARARRTNLAGVTNAATASESALATPFSGSRRWRWSYSGIFWLIFLAPAIRATLNSDRDIAARIATLVCFALFIAVYLVSVPLTASRRWNDPVRYLTPVVVLVLGLLTMPVAGEDGVSTFVYVAVVGVGLLPPRIAIGFAVSIAALATVLIETVPGWTRDPASLLFSIGLATVAASAFMRLIRRNAELAVARDDLAHLAV